MARKVFISVLGSTNYGKCKYEFKEKGFLSEQVRFIQEATLDMLQKQEVWGEDAIGFICVTEGERGSYELNWKDNGHKDRTSGSYIHCEGLETRLKRLKLPFEIEPVLIKDGNDKEEIWEVFDKIFKLLKDDDEKEKYSLIVRKIFELPYKKKLTKDVYYSLSQGGRNDLNHAGFRPLSDAKTTGYFKNKLKEYIVRYEKLKT